MKTHAIARKGILFSIAPYPSYCPNPIGFRWAIFRDGTMVGAARKLDDARRKVESGRLDSEQGSATQPS